MGGIEFGTVVIRFLSWYEIINLSNPKTGCKINLGLADPRKSIFWSLVLTGLIIIPCLEMVLDWWTSQR